MGYYQKIIIIGAGRSGTNMLRDLLVKLPSTDTWDCDEINPIWKHGNISKDTDELKVEDASENVKKFIRKEFDKIQKSTSAPIIIEKTCANSLRVPFVYSILPEAKYIFIFRDGRDVISSAMKRWQSKLDFFYTFKKLRYVPKQDLMYYIAKYGMNRISRLFSGTKSLSFWGPVYLGMSEDIAQKDLHLVCAKQWAKCVENTKESMKCLPSENRFEVRYEDFVNAPEAILKKITSFIGVPVSDDLLKECVSNVRRSSVGNYREELNDKELLEIEPIIKKAMHLSGYE